MDATDEFQEADILWPDTTEDEQVVPFATTDMVMEEEPYGATACSVSGALAPAFGRRLFEGLFIPGAAGPSSSTGARPDADHDDEEEWQEADVLWPDTVGILPRGAAGRELLSPFPGRHVSPAAARRDRWRPAASSPIDIPTNVAARRRFNSGRR